MNKEPLGTDSRACPSCGSIRLRPLSGDCCATALCFARSSTGRIDRAQSRMAEARAASQDDPPRTPTGFDAQARVGAIDIPPETIVTAEDTRW